MSPPVPQPENELAAPLPPFPVAWPVFKKLGRLLDRVGLDLLLAGAMALILWVVLTTHGDSVRIAQATVLYPVGMMSLLLLTRLAIHGHGPERHRIVLQTLRDWLPFILIDLIYENLHDLSRHFQNHDIAGTLMEWDIRLFGVEPTVWSGRFLHPLLTDYMAFAYALYFILPLFVMYCLSFRNLRPRLREMILALSLSFLLGFLGYAFFPCSPPRYFLEGPFAESARLQGLFLFEFLQNRWDHLSAVRSGAFPSLHVAISAIALVYTFRLRRCSRFDRWLFRIYIPLAISLWVSTIYLRHHWFIDIAAGWLLAWFCCWIAPLLARR